MTWMMFDNKILHPESGAYFSLDRIESYSKAIWFDLRYHTCTSTTDFFAESFELEEQAQQRFEELKNTLIRKRRYVIKDDGSLQNILSEEL